MNGFSEKEISRMRKGKRGTKPLIPLFVFSCIFYLISLTLFIINLDENTDYFMKMSAYIFLGLGIITSVQVVTFPAFFSKDLIRRVNNELYNSTFNEIPTSTNFPIDRSYLSELKFLNCSINLLNQDAEFNSSRGKTEIYDIRNLIGKGETFLETKKNEKDNINGTLLILTNDFWSFKDTTIISKELSGMPLFFKSEIISEYQDLYISSSNQSLNEIEYSDEIIVLINVIQDKFNKPFILSIKENKIFLLITDLRASIHPISFKSTHPYDAFKNKGSSIKPLGELTNLIFNTFNK